MGDGPGIPIGEVEEIRDQEVAARVLNSVANDISRRLLDDISGRSKFEHALVHLKIWGTIHWSADLGDPNAPTKSDGLDISHRACHEVLHTGPEGPVSIETCLDAGPPIKWDLPDSEGQHRVGFVASIDLTGRHYLNVAIGPSGWRFGSFIGGSIEIRPLSEQKADLSRGFDYLDFEIVQAIRRP
jgi:hypothetical protein